MNPLSLSPDRLRFLVDGQPFVWRGTLDWPFYGRFLREGEEYARAVLRDRRSVGANTVCFAGMLAWDDWGFNPSTEYYWSDTRGMRRLADIAAEEDMRLCVVVLCDTKQLMPDLTAMQLHWMRWLVTLGDKNNVSFVVANQPGHPTQAIRPEDTRLFTGVSSFPQLLCARNNPFEDANPVLPPMDWSCYCVRRDYKGLFAGMDCWYCTHGYQAEHAHEWAGVHQATVLFEPPRIEAGTEYGLGAQDANYWANPGLWRQLGRGLCYEGTVGGNAYSRQGRNADLLTGIIRDCYVEFLGNIPSP